jgi:hypothetical protein
MILRENALTAAKKKLQTLTILFLIVLAEELPSIIVFLLVAGAITTKAITILTACPQTLGN